MELVSLYLTDDEVGSRTAIVAHADLGLARVPQPPEGVVIHELNLDEYYAGIIDDANEPDSCRLKLGPRLPETMALARVTGFPVAASPFRSQPVADIATALRSGMSQS